MIDVKNELKLIKKLMEDINENINKINVGNIKDGDSNRQLGNIRVNIVNIGHKLIDCETILERKGNKQ